MCVILIIDIVDGKVLTVPIKDRLGVVALAIMIMKFDGDDIYDYKMLSSLAYMGTYLYFLKKLYLDIKNWETSLTKPSTEEPFKL